MTTNLNIVFAGTPDFAVPALKALINSNDRVIAVYTQPDRPAGRGRKLTQSPIKEVALEHHLPLFQPATLKHPDAEKALIDLKPDLMIVAAYGLILPQAILDIPRYGCINIHASLLPRWRGAAPIQHAILQGDKETGITIMQMDKGLDTGDILVTEKCPIKEDENSEILTEKLSHLGAQALLQAIVQLKEGTLHPLSQDEKHASYAGKITKASGLIDWQQSATDIHRLIQAYYPWPIAYTTFKENERLRVISAKIGTLDTTSASPGTIVSLSPKGIEIATGQGTLLLTKIQQAGKKPLDCKDFLNSQREKLKIGLAL